MILFTPFIGLGRNFGGPPHLETRKHNARPLSLHEFCSHSAVVSRHRTNKRRRSSRLNRYSRNWARQKKKRPAPLQYLATRDQRARSSGPHNFDGTRPSSQNKQRTCQQKNVITEEEDERRFIGARQRTPKRQHKTLTAARKKQEFCCHSRRRH
jgi:hypothetical protein